MSIQIGVDCIDCRVLAPNVGDGGHLGAPDIEPLDVAEAAGEEMPTFGYFYEALQGIGIRPYDLVVLSEFLVAHKGHGLQISDGSDVPEKRILSDTKAQAKEKERRTQSGEFRMLRYEIECEKCRKSLKAPAPELLQAGEAFSPSSEAVATFLKRWARDAGDSWHYGLMGIVDPNDAFMEKLLALLKTHRRHKLTVRLTELGTARRLSSG